MKKEMTTLNGEKIILELSEYDAAQLLALIKKEMGQADQPTQYYWERQIQKILQSIDRASFNSFHRSISFEDMICRY
jgi:hypothetical protein